MSNTVTIYAPGSNTETPPVASIGWDYRGADKAGINGRFGVAVDKSGKVYVANQADGYNFDGSITVYSAGSTGNVAPIAKISGTKTEDKTALNSPNGLAVDAANNSTFSMSLSAGQGGHINIYPPGANGNVAPKATMPIGARAYTQLKSPAGLALDSGGVLRNERWRIRLGYHLCGGQQG